MELTPVPRMTKAGQPCTLPPAMATITLVSGEGEFCLQPLCGGDFEGWSLF